MRDRNICVSNGFVWEKAELHLKSAIQNFNRHDITKIVALDLLKSIVK